MDEKAGANRQAVVLLLKSISKARWVFVTCFALSLLMNAAVLRRFGAAAIRADDSEVVLLTFFAAVWMVLANFLFSWFGYNIRDDAIERHNTSALIALCGALFAVAIMYAGGSAGEGPSYGNNFFSAGLATAAWFLLWMLFEYAMKVSISIAEERDLASGIRMAGFLMATGLILGRAVAGDWHSEEETMRDFIGDGWPALALWGMALVIEFFARPSRQRPFPRLLFPGIVPALFYLALAAVWLWFAGPWEGMNR